MGSDATERGTTGCIAKLFKRGQARSSRTPLSNFAYSIVSAGRHMMARPSHGDGTCDMRATRFLLCLSFTSKTEAG